MERWRATRLGLAERDRDDDDRAAGDELLAEFQAHQHEAVVDEPDHERAHDGADHRAGPAE